MPCLSISCVRDRQDTDFLRNLWKRHSSFHLCHVLAWILHFSSNSRLNQEERLLSTIQSSEVIRAKQKILFMSQQEAFADVFSLIRQGRLLPKVHRLKNYLIQISDSGILLVHNLVRRDDQPSQPVTLVLLSTKSFLTHLLVRTLHHTYSHAGISAMTSILGHFYLIPGLRNLLKHVSRTYPQCQRAYARLLSHQMGLLPTTRTTPSPPFTVTGVDFAGHFVLCRGHTRKPVLVKCYIVIFVCLSTKCVHLDLCASLSTDDFKATLRRFTARRGVPAHVYCDNGTNFIGFL